MNVTIPVGREAILTCVVDDLSGFKVRKRAARFRIYEKIMSGCR